jgi:methyl-accepting chemotaxis protein
MVKGFNHRAKNPNTQTPTAKKEAIQTMIKNLKLRTRMLVYICPLLCIAFGFTVSFVTISARNLVKTQALREAREIASRYSSVIKAEIEVAMNAARTIAQTFEGIKAHGDIPERAMLDAVLKQVLEKNTDFIGVWSVWEPNALDGNDAEFADEWGHDETGRYIPYWNRATGFPEVEPAANYNVPGKNDYYLLPLNTGKEMITDPRMYPISGADVLMTRVSIPIFYQGKAVGVAGIDIMLSTFELLVARIRPFETGTVALISHGGKYAAHPDSAMVTQDIGISEQWNAAKHAISAGEFFQFVDIAETSHNELVRIFVPVILGKSETPWSFLVNVPMTEVLRSAVKFTAVSMTIGIVSLLIMIGIVFIITASVTRPLREIVSIADSIAAGDLSRDIAIRQQDEIGHLAHAFRNMKNRINDMLNEMNTLIVAAQNGQLDMRGNAGRFSKSWQELVTGMNSVIDAFAEPVYVTANALDMLAKGAVPEYIAETYKGDFNLIKNNLNVLIGVTKETERVAGEIAGGNLSVEVRERSEQDRLMKSLNLMIQKLNAIMNETGAMIHAVGMGKLDIRGNAENYEGGWRKLITGINDLIESLSNAVSKSAALGQEMELARKIQTSLLPTLTDSMHPEFEISAAMIPAEQVGGDFYDLSFDRAGNLWIAVGDVSGHGVTPGLIMMMAQTVHTTVTANLECDARSVVIKINEVLYMNVHDRLRENHFMTFTALKYLGDGCFQHAGAHLSMIVFREKTGTCELIKTGGVYLNFKKDISSATKNRKFFLNPGDTLVLYTDGLTESENPEGKMLDIDGFVKIVEKHAHRYPEAMKDMIMADVIKWCDDRRADDMTLVIVRRKLTTGG